jgi:SAM-dependent methyltransferase
MDAASGPDRFLISAQELAKRRFRCRPAVDSLASAAREFRETCNACGSGQSCVVSFSDRYGFEVRTALCTRCGLVYLADRLTQEGYARFYGGGHYRKLTSAFAGSAATMDDLQLDQLNYSRSLIRFLRGHVPSAGGARALDVGGSSGQVAAELVKAFRVRGTVLDPSEEEIAAARKLGLEGIVGSAETYDSDERFDLVLLCRTVEHLFDLRGTFEKLRGMLAPGGLFYCDFLDFPELCRITGHPQTVSKLDHCYWLSLRTAPALFRSLGFEIVSIHVVPKPQFVGVLLRRAEPCAMETVAWCDMHDQIRFLQQIASDWLRLPGATDGLAVRVRNKVTRMVRA